MPPKKGTSNNPGGRPKGIPNKATTKAREAIAKLVDGNADRLLGWLDRVAEDNPSEAFKLLANVMEYHLPKLARQELVGDADNPLDINVNITKDDEDILTRYSKQKKEPTK